MGIQKGTLHCAQYSTAQHCQIGCYGTKALNRVDKDVLRERNNC